MKPPGLQSTAPTILDGLLGEHGVLRAILDDLEARGPAFETLARLRAAAAFLDTPLLSHARLEEEFLLAPLEAAVGGLPPVEVMRSEHVEIEERVRALLREDHADLSERLHGIQSTKDAEAALRELIGLVHLARDHFTKEEAVLFPLAAQILGEGRLRELGASWAAERNLQLTP